MATTPLVSLCIPTFEHVHFLPAWVAGVEQRLCDSGGSPSIALDAGLRAVLDERRHVRGDP